MQNKKKKKKNKNRVCYYFDNLIKPKKLTTKNILIDNKNWTYFVIYFSRFDNGKSIRMLSLCYSKLIGTIEETEGKYT